MAFDFNFPTARENVVLDREFLKHLVGIVNNIMRGKTNNRGEVTLTASATSTTVTDPNVGASSTIVLSPLTANAAGALSTTYITAGNGSFEITHANNAQTDRDFRYVVVG